MCTDCGDCTGCSEISIPSGTDGSPGASIESGVYNADGNIQFTLSNATTFIVEIPKDDWRLYNTADVTSAVFTPTTGTILGEDLITTGYLALSYKTISSDTAHIRFDGTAKINIDASVDLSTQGQFNITLKYPGFTSNLFTGSKTFANNLPFAAQEIPVYLLFSAAGLPSPIHATGVASVNSSGTENRIIIGAWPNITVTGNYTVKISFNATEQIT